MAKTDSSLKVGDKVTILVGTPEDRPVHGTVKVVQDETGKKVGVELDEYTVYGHSLDGVVDEREQGDGLPVVGKGWWTTEENVSKD
jgi:preprotein translocase subunit YajC